jgi:sugar phosphate isomerase/epimerase
VHPSKISIQLANLKLPFRKALLAASQLGAKAVEIDARGELKPQNLSETGLREVRKLLDEMELKVAAVGFSTRRGYDVADELDRRIAATKDAMKFARALGASVVVNQIGHVPEDSESDGWKIMVESLTDLSRYGNKVGALLSAQTGSESGPDLARLLQALPPQGIGVDLDPGSLIIHGFSPLDAIGALGPHIVHVHARDAVRDRARGQSLEVPLGRGSADFPALLGALEEHAYRGYFTVARENAADPTFELGEAVKYLNNLG